MFDHFLGFNTLFFTFYTFPFKLNEVLIKNENEYSQYTIFIKSCLINKNTYNQVREILLKVKYLCKTLQVKSRKKIKSTFKG